MAPAAPDLFTRDDLELAGFRGWGTWQAVRDGTAMVPAAPDIYVVYRPSSLRPSFTATGTGGWFKGRDPNVPFAVLEAKWVPGTSVVYIGKATKLRERLRTYARFGAGARAGHWGGRYIWQLDDPDLLVAWRTVGDDVGAARADETVLLTRFAELHDGRLPFANLTW